MFRILFHFATAAMLSSHALAQQFPARPVKVILAAPAGTGPDTVMRLVGDKLAQAWGQQILIENRPGAQGWIAYEMAKKQPADGYTLVQIPNDHASLHPLLFKSLPIDYVNDFEAVAGLYSAHFFLVVGSNAPWNSVSDLIAAAKAKPGALNYGSWGAGTVAHLAGSLLERAAGIKMTHVAFKDLSQLYVGVGNGELHWAMGTVASTGPLYRAKKLKYLAIAAPERFAGFADIPRVSESGGPGDFEIRAMMGLFAPRGVPGPILNFISVGVGRALNEPDVRGKLTGVGFAPFVSTGKELADQFAADSRRFADVVRQQNITLD
ncbi:MAG: Bug family tripartite tricarboxylate transporter substrate binding protein [Burkholderiales bacterium]